MDVYTIEMERVVLPPDTADRLLSIECRGSKENSVSGNAKPNSVKQNNKPSFKSNLVNGARPMTVSFSFMG